MRWKQAPILFVGSMLAAVTIADDGHHSVSFRPEPAHRMAALTDGYGTLSIPITCQQGISQRYFDLGMAMLYGLDHWSAAQAFHSIVVAEPDCAIGWWGLAMANFAYPEVAAEYLEHAIRHHETASASGQRWIRLLRSYSAEDSPERNRLRLIEALRDQMQLHPSDDELAGLYVREMLLNGFGDADSDNGVQISRIIHTLRQASPDHPIITCEAVFWSAEDPDRARQCAELSLETTPENPHAWVVAGRLHMQDGSYAEAVSRFRTASKLFHQQMVRNDLVPDELPGYAGAQDLLVQSLAANGQVWEAIRISRAMSQCPCIRASDVDRFMSPYPGSHRVLGARRYAGLLADFELWAELEKFVSTVDFLGTGGELDVRRASALSAMSLGKSIAVEDRISALRSTYAQTVYDGFVIQGSGHSHGRESGEEDRATAALQRRSLRGQQDLREVLLHQTFLNMDRNELAAALKGSGQSHELWTAPYHLAAYERGKALYAAEYAWQFDPNHALVLARCAEFYAEAEEPEKSALMRQHLKTRTKLFEQALPISERLIDLERSTQADAVDLSDSTGLSLASAQTESAVPVWQPPLALDWSLPDRHGNVHSLSDYRGEPVLLVFFLGAGCPHCIEQLQALGPAKHFTDELGIKIIAVSTDSVQGVREMFEVEGAEEVLPFTMVCDEKHSVFHQYGLANELAEEPLHGTFLIDGEGCIRWKNTSIEPFMDFDFFWREARAQLRMPAAEKQSPKISATIR